MRTAIQFSIREKIPTNNTIYTQGRFTNRRTKTNEARSFAEKMGWISKAAMNKAGARMTLAGVAIEIDFTFPDHRRRDCNNFDKLICDAMNGIVYKDDTQVAALDLWTGAYMKYRKRIVKGIWGADIKLFWEI